MSVAVVVVVGMVLGMAVLAVLQREARRGRARASGALRGDDGGFVPVMFGDAGDGSCDSGSDAGCGDGGGGDGGGGGGGGGD